MTDEQMTLGEAEIIKALECCGNMNDCKKECPLDDLGGIDKCIHTLILNALDLINRQKSELADLNNLLKLSNDIINEFSKKIDEQKAEIERLEGWQDLLKAEKHSLIKTEAIKEFANKVEQKCLEKGIYPACVKRAIEQIKEEMTEQKG